MRRNLIQVSSEGGTVNSCNFFAAIVLQFLPSWSVCIKFWGEWPSVLWRYIENWKDPGSNSSRCSAKIWEPTSLRGSRWPSTWNQYPNAVINIGLLRLPPRQWLSWPWGSKVAVQYISVCTQAAFACSKSTIFVVNFEQISRIVLLLLLLTLNN